VELYENIIENKPVNEADDYNDFVNRRRNNKKSIRTKVTTLMENGEVHSEIMGTKNDEELKSSNDGNNENKANINVQENNEQNVSSFQNATDDNNVNSGTTESQKKDNVKSDTTKDTDTKNKNIEDKTVLGMKPIYGYSMITVIALVGIVAAVKVFKNKNKLVLNT